MLPNIFNLCIGIYVPPVENSWKAWNSVKSLKCFLRSSHLDDDCNDLLRNSSQNFSSFLERLQNGKDIVSWSMLKNREKRCIPCFILLDIGK